MGLSQPPHEVLTSGMNNSTNAGGTIKPCNIRLLHPSTASKVPLSNSPFSAAADSTKYWPNGATIGIAFMGNTANSTDNSKFVKDKVMQFAKTWEQFANITFDFNSQNPDIRIAFGPDAGSWSYIAMDCRGVDKDKPTMNYGWFHDNTSDDEFSRVVVHEFGHALGLVHELQSPAAGVIHWNKSAVYEWYKKNDGWDSTQVDQQVLNPLTGDQYIFTSFDPTSIMCYPVDASLTTDGFSVDWNHYLSDLDKKFIASVYPKAVEVTQNPGQFDCSMIRNTLDASSYNGTQIKLAHAFSELPKVAVGIVNLDIDQHHYPRAKVWTERVTRGDFMLHCDSYDDTTLYNLGAAYMALPQKPDNNIVVGTWETRSLHDWRSTPQKNNAMVKFNRNGANRWNSPPTVIVFLTWIDMTNNANWRINAYPTNISTDGFQINIDTRDDSTLFYGAVNWVAFPNSSRVAGGTIDLDSTFPNVQEHRTGHVDFPSGQNLRDPQVMLALNGFDMGCAVNMRVVVAVTNVTATGFDWSVTTRDGSLVYGASLSWLAVGKDLLP